MSDCVKSVPAAETIQVKESAKLAELGTVESGAVDEKGDGPNKQDHESEKKTCEGDCVESKEETVVDGTQQIKRKSLDDGDREDEVTKKARKDEVTKKARKDEDDEEAGDEEASSEKSDENDDAVEKDAEGDEAADEAEETAS